MFVHRILSVALDLLWFALGVSSSYEPYPCTKPAVRKEWRTFSTEQKAEWIRAINVSIDALLTFDRLSEALSGFQCLSKLPHDLALTPLVDPSVSRIPPVNKSSSYFDGLTHFICRFSLWGVLTSFYIDIVYIHMDLNTRVRRANTIDTTLH